MCMCISVSLAHYHNLSVYRTHTHNSYCSMCVCNACLHAQERARQAKSKQRQVASGTKVLDLSKGGDDQEGLLDNLLETLTSGSAFNPK